MGVGRNRKVGDMGSQEGIRVGSNRKVMRGTVWRLWAVGVGRKPPEGGVGRLTLVLPGAFPCPHDLRLPWLSSQVVEAIEYLKRPERLGLGAASVLPASKPNKQRKMGEGVHVCVCVCVRGGGPRKRDGARWLRGSIMYSGWPNGAGGSLEEAQDGSASSRYSDLPVTLPLEEEPFSTTPRCGPPQVMPLRRCGARSSCLPPMRTGGSAMCASWTRS